jgi:hypothetical protein
MMLAAIRSKRPSAKAMVQHVRAYGGGAALLWTEESYNGATVLERCVEKLPLKKLLEFFRLLISENREAYVGETTDWLPDRQNFKVVLHGLVSLRAPAELIRLLVEADRGALRVETDQENLPIHKACDTLCDITSRNSGPIDLATVRLLVEHDPEGTTLKARGEDGRLPLHSACRWLSCSGDYPQVLDAIQLLVDACPGALEVSDDYALTPVMAALQPGLRPFSRDAFRLLLGMIRRGGPESLRGKCTESGTVVTTALGRAFSWYPIRKLVSALIEADRGALSLRNEDGKLPLHEAFDGSKALEGGLEALGAVQLLIDASPAALQARDNDGKTPVMVALSYLGGGPAPDVVQFTKEIVQRAPVSVRGTCWEGRSTGQPPYRTSALELVCQRKRLASLFSTVLEAWPAALCLSLTGTLASVQAEIAPSVRREARAVFLALIEVLLHETAAGCVPEAVRDHVRRVVGELVPRRDLDLGSFATSQAIRKIGDGQDFLRLRSGVLDYAPLREFLEQSEVVQDVVSGLWRMSKAGRCLGSEAERGGWEDGGSAAQRIRVLQAADGNLSSLFLYLRGRATVLVCGQSTFQGTRVKSPARKRKAENDLEEYLEEQSELEAKDELIAALQDRLAAVQATLTEAKKQKLRDEKNESLDKVRAQLDETCLMLRMSHRRASSPSCI